MPTLNPSFPLRPYVLLNRTRLIWAAIASVLSALLMLFWTTAEYPTDFGILWHHFCGCPPDPADTFALLNISSFTCFVIGILLGAGVGTQVAYAVPNSQGLNGEARMLLTRPTPRIAVLLTPVFIAAIAITVLPAAGLLLLLGWLRLVHAPALGHLVDLARLVPSAAALPQHPSLVQVLTAVHFTWHYVASLSMGFSGYALFYASRWTIHSRNKWVRLSSSLSFLVFTFPAMGVFSRRFSASIFLMSSRHGDIGYLPPASLIAAHFLFAAVVLYGCWTIAREVEL